MRIAFDLDGMLIPAAGSPMPVEPLGLLARLISSEKIRSGTPRLLAALRGSGHEIWLYTTSYRSPARLRAWFAAFGVRLTGVINQTRHDAVVPRAPSSKYPPAFGIDLLVDDSEGVALEGRRHGFTVLRIVEHDAAWCSHVVLAVRMAHDRQSVGSAIAALSTKILPAITR
jgi:hypothetical protein